MRFRRSASGQRRHIIIYPWHLNSSLLSNFDHFCPDSIEGRVYWAGPSAFVGTTVGGLNAQSSYLCCYQTKMLHNVLCMFMYGLFHLFQSSGQNKLTQLLYTRKMRRRKKTRRAAAFVSAVLATRPRRTMWTWARSQDWWKNIVLGMFTDDQWLEHFCMR